MQYRKLGRTGLRVSNICLGAMTFGEQVSESEALKIIDAALASGVNFIDVADVYCDGKSEEIIGKALAGKRDSVVLATKVGRIKSGPTPGHIDLSRKHIMQGVEDSLRRLKTDHIDLYYVHWPDLATTLEETLVALDDLVHQGKVRYIGCSNFTAWRLCKALWTSDISKLARFDCIQSVYNLLLRVIEDELLPLCQSEEIGVCVFNPLAGGLLTGKHEQNKPPVEGTRFSGVSGPIYQERYWRTANFAAISRLQEVARQNNCSLAQFSLAWILANTTVTAAIIGVSSFNHLEENLKAAEIKLSKEAIAACDEEWQHIRPQKFFYGR